MRHIDRLQIQAMDENIIKVEFDRERDSYEGPSHSHTRQYTIYLKDPLASTTLLALKTHIIQLHKQFPTLAHSLDWPLHESEVFIDMSTGDSVLTPEKYSDSHTLHHIYPNLNSNPILKLLSANEVKHSRYSIPILINQTHFKVPCNVLGTTLNTNTSLLRVIAHHYNTTMKGSQKPYIEPEDLVLAYRCTTALSRSNLGQLAPREFHLAWNYHAIIKETAWGSFKGALLGCLGRMLWNVYHKHPKALHNCLYSAAYGAIAISILKGTHTIIQNYQAWQNLTYWEKHLLPSGTTEVSFS